MVPVSLCCVLGQHTFTVIVPLSTQEYKLISVNCNGRSDKMLGISCECDELASHPGGVAILLVTLYYKNRSDKTKQNKQTNERTNERTNKKQDKLGLCRPVVGMQTLPYLLPPINIVKTEKSFS